MVEAASPGRTHGIEIKERLRAHLANTKPQPPHLVEADRVELVQAWARLALEILHELVQRELGLMFPILTRSGASEDTVLFLHTLDENQRRGRALVRRHLEGLPPLIGANESRKFFITCDRTQLVQRIELRFEAMLNANALQEVSELAARKLDPALPVMKAHGVPWLIRHVKGEISLSDAQAGVVMDTRRYAKRQITWFRNQMEGWKWVESQRALDVILAELQSE